MTYFSQTYTSNSTITIPAFAQNISISIAGASGGSGGLDASNSPASGGFGRFGSFTLPTLTSSRNLTLNIGTVGRPGASNATSGTPGFGGNGVASGGFGGRSGPSGASGSGGGGGGASGVYDSSVGAWIIVAGGGGGGGGASYPNVPGRQGLSGTGWSGSGGTVASITSGGNGGDCPTDGGGGGGGGGGASGGGGGNNGFDVSTGNVQAGGGGGGRSGYRSTACTWTGSTSSHSGNGYISVSYINVPPPTINFFTVSPTSIILGNSSTLSWSVTGEQISNISIDQGVGNVSGLTSKVVSPTSTRTYTLSVTNPSGTVTRNVTVSVYTPPNVILTSDDSSIIRGQSTYLRWTTTGDATSATLDQGIGAVNINGNRLISPTTTTTYTINVTGLGGNDSDTRTITVYQPPTVELSGPVILNYGQQGTLTYSATNVDISLTLTPTYNYRGGGVTGTVVNLPTGSSVGPTNTATVIPYTDLGPFSVTYVIVATGNGGQETKQITVPINIDETPDNFLIPDSDDLLKEQAPVSTPDATITSYQIQIDDIDIPIEVKSNKPILIKKNNDDWIKLRQL
jgi:hypothetical protein